jgi:hypothetical protein
MHGIKEKCTQGFGPEIQRQESEDLDTDIRINTTYILSNVGGGLWNEFNRLRIRTKWQTVVSTVMKLQSPQNWRNFLTSRATTSFL